MSQPTAYILRGLPGSGKSTLAAKMHADTGAEIVNRDAIRMALHGTYWSGEEEKEDEVTLYEQSLIVDNVKKGRDVIVDATNLNPVHFDSLVLAAEYFGAHVEVITLRTSIEQCIANDSARRERGDRFVGEEVIRKLAELSPEFVTEALV